MNKCCYYIFVAFLLLIPNIINATCENKIHNFEKEIQNLEQFEKKVNFLQDKFNHIKNFSLNELLLFENDDILLFKKHCNSVRKTLYDVFTNFPWNEFCQQIELKIQKLKSERNTFFEKINSSFSSFLHTIHNYTHSLLQENDSIISTNVLENPFIPQIILENHPFLDETPLFSNFVSYDQILEYILKLKTFLENIESNWPEDEVFSFFDQQIEFKEIYVQYVQKMKEAEVKLKFKILIFHVLKIYMPHDPVSKTFAIRLEQEFFELDKFLFHLTQLYKKFPLLQKQILEIKDSKPFLIFQFLPLYFWHRTKPLFFLRNYTKNKIYQLKI
jgi:hypothetical protein